MRHKCFSGFTVFRADDGVFSCITVPVTALWLGLLARKPGLNSLEHVRMAGRTGVPQVNIIDQLCEANGSVAVSIGFGDALGLGKRNDREK